MKQKLISFCAEYLIFVGALVVIVLVLNQVSLYESIRIIGNISVTIISLWFLGAFLKYIIRKERPKVMKRLGVERDRYAFPSMHALTLAASATFVIMHNIYLGVIAYAIAFIVMYARVKTHMHFAVDMIAGFCLGVVFTYIFSPAIDNCLSILLNIVHKAL